MDRLNYLTLVNIRLCPMFCYFKPCLNEQTCRFIFFIEVRLTYIKLAILKRIIQWHLVHSCCTTTLSISFQNISITPKGNPIATEQSLPCLPFSEPVAIIDPHLSLQICLSRIFHINRVAQCVTVRV